ncbi:unnamed protein product [Ostreobium quekettii]|uniref:Uncharacterized protein n=1 Tax=Ostreobium quekettii TaxID=121088 RepID=A0A8S1J8Q3_9CHLO|nr:unnamed protein product [Ostreobium quekettii]|eukprot:evm.model.scf_892.4 EVM.evm.TU.scf_892.4   scf_892:30872-32554(+)
MLLVPFSSKKAVTFWRQQFRSVQHTWTCAMIQATHKDCRAKALHADAAAAGVPAIITCGIYPGVSNVIAAHIAARSLGEADKDGNYTEPSSDAPALSRLRYSYYTAGSGGVGNTLLVTSFMLTGEPVTAYKDGQKVVVEPLSQPTTIDFGPVVGRKGAYLWNLPEVASAHNCMGVPNVSARFGTSPQVWNWVMWLMARLVPKDVLQDREAMSVLANISEPMIRLVDLFVGETVAMRVDAELEGGKAASGLFVHPKLSESVGACVGAFAQCMLRGDTKPGVWFPEEKGALRNRRDLLALASEGCQVLVVNQPPWVIEQEPKQLGLGIYM